MRIFWTTSLCALWQAINHNWVHFNVWFWTKQVQEQWLSLISEWYRNNLTTSVCPLLQAHINAVIPSFVFAFTSMFLLFEWSKNNLTTSVCPLKQANMNAVHPLFVLAFNSMLESFRSSSIIFVLPLVHASKSSSQTLGISRLTIFSISISKTNSVALTCSNQITLLFL